MKYARFKDYLEGAKENVLNEKEYIAVTRMLDDLMDIVEQQDAHITHLTEELDKLTDIINNN